MKFIPALLGLCPLLALGLRAAELPLDLDAAQSRVEIVVKATMDSFTGSLDAYEADIRVDSASGEVGAAHVGFHFSDVKTGNADRDTEMHEWQGTRDHPDGAFTLAAIERDEKGGRIARGALEFHGVSRELRFPITVTHEGARYAVDGEAVVDTRTFGLPVIRKFMVLKVDPEVRVRFHLQGEVRAE